MQNTRLVAVDTSDHLLQTARKRLLQSFLVFTMLASIVLTFSNVQAGITQFNIAPIIAIGSAVMLAFVTRGRLILVVGYIITVALLIGAVTGYINQGQIATVSYLILSIALVTSALIGAGIFFWLTMVISFLIIIGVSVAFTLQQNVETQIELVRQFALVFTSGLVPLIIGGVTRYFVSALQETIYQARRSATLLEASAIIGQNMSQMLELTELLDRAVEIIRDRFAFNHVAVFLLDTEQQYALLTAATGDVGERLLSRGFRLLVDSESVVGRVSKAKDLIVARDSQVSGGAASVLADTRSQIGLPITDTEGIIGVLDIQSNRSDAFTDTEIQALQVIANQLATAIRNARLFEEKERSIRENKRLFIESETNLRENQRLNRQLTRDAWLQYLQTDRSVAGITLEGLEVAKTADWSPQMLDAGRRRRPVTASNGQSQTVAVPIELRGEVVGAIEVETNDRNPEETADMVRAISQRLAVSLDNARLFEESNEATLQEKRVADIVSQYQSANTVDELLKITLAGLSETLGAEHGSIRLGTLPDTFDDTVPLNPQVNGDNVE